MATLEIRQIQAMLAQCNPAESLDDQDPRYLALHHEPDGSEINWTDPLHTTLRLK